MSSQLFQRKFFYDNCKDMTICRKKLDSLKYVLLNSMMKIFLTNKILYKINRKKGVFSCNRFKLCKFYFSKLLHCAFKEVLNIFDREIIDRTVRKVTQFKTKFNKQFVVRHVQSKLKCF